MNVGTRRRHQTRDPLKVAVVTWSVNHNPLGRAHVLGELLAHEFDVEIVGFEFPAFGPGIWAPLRDSGITIHSYMGSGFPAQFDLMEEVGRHLDADAVVVSKPRLPGLGVGFIAKEALNRALVLDIDDWELAFVHAQTGIDMDDIDAIEGDDSVLEPYGRVWTQVCERLAPRAVDALTVSNHTLQDRYGGVVIPHARDERLFDPRRFDRRAVRDRLGVGPDTRLILFGGTARRHKGVLELAEAVAALGDRSAVLCLIETRELDELRPDLERLGCPFIGIPPISFEDMPAIVAAADVTVVIQDPRHPTSSHQMPAKITDALAMEVPCIVNRVPPLEPLIDAGHLEVVGPEGLTAELERIFDDYGAAKRRAIAGRELFLESFSHSAVAPIMGGVVRSAIEAAEPLRSEARRLLSIQRRLFGHQQGTTRATGSSSELGPVGSTPVRRRPRTRGGPYDLVVFWKQNDSNIYERRADMLVEQLARSDRVAQVVHFDTPLGVEALHRMGQAHGLDQNRLLHDTTIRRVLGYESATSFFRYTFLYDDRNDRYDSPRRSQYLEFVDEVFRLHGIGSRDTVFWLYPTSDDLPDLVDRFQPTITVSDVVDDNRTWYVPGTNAYTQISNNYAAVLARSDIVLANCESVALAMSQFHDSIEVMPNAYDLEPRDELIDTEVPIDLGNLSGPIIGYVGNLSSRIDIGLIDHLAVSRPAWNIVLIGSNHAGQEILSLARHQNVRFLGPKPSREAKRYICAFDVAMIPHLDNEMTRSMNPLKAYVYCALGVPVVSTGVANIEAPPELIAIANGRDEFVRAIEASLAKPRVVLTEDHRKTLQENTWQVRAKRALELIDIKREGAVGE